MSRCSKCGEPVQDSDSFCGECGQAMAVPSPERVAHEPRAMAPVVPPKPTSAPPKPLIRPSSPVTTVRPDPDPPRARWQAAGEARQNEVYIGHRLSYNPPHAVETAFGGTTDNRALFVMLIRGIVIFVVGQALSWIVIIAGVLLGGSAGALAQSGDVASAIGVPILFVSVALFFASFVLPWFVPYRELLSDWCLTVEGKATQAPDAFAMIYGKIAQRRLPVTLNVRRIQGMAEGGQANNYIVCRSGRYFAYLSVLPFGTDLFLSWTMWRRLIPFTFLLRMIGEFLGPLFGMDELRRTLASEHAKAMREAIHNSMREGVEVATEGRRVDLQATFGFDIPIEPSAKA